MIPTRWLTGFLVSTFVPRILAAGVGGWTTNGPDGGDILSLAVDPHRPTTIYAGTADRVFKTEDGGNHWALSATGMAANSIVLSLAIDPSQPSTLYAGTEYATGLFKSTDAGASWTPKLPLSSVLAVVVDPTATNNVYVGIVGGVLQSTDGGDHWTDISKGLTSFYVQALVIDPPTGDLYAGTASGLFRKRGGSGNDWTIVPVLSTADVPALAVASTNPSRIYTVTSGGLFSSTDGNNWLAAGSGLPPFLYSVGIDPVHPSTIYLGTDRGVYKSTDSASTWSAVGPSGNSQVVLSLAVDPLTPENIYAGMFGQGVYKSATSGLTWTLSTAGLGRTNIHAVVEDPSNAAVIYAGAIGGGVYKSIDRGQTWSAVNAGLLNTYVQALALDPVNSSTIYAGTGGASASGGVFKSVDGGLHWIQSTLSGSDVQAIVVDPRTHTTVYAGTYGGGIYKTIDGGQSWTAINSGLTEPAIYAISLDPTAPSTLFAGTYGGGIFKSTDGGASWVPKNAGLSSIVLSLAIDPGSASTVYAGSAFDREIFFVSTDGGETWQVRNAGLPIALGETWAIATDHAYSGLLYVGMNEGVFKSFDGGAHWTSYDNELTQTFVFSLAIDPDGSTLHAGTQGGGVFSYTIRLPAPTATPTEIPVTPARAPTPPSGSAAVVPTLSFQTLALLGLALATVGLLLLKR
jgi:photosystem II stability/assembly factor-like uncharacterized protein